MSKAASYFTNPQQTKMLKTFGFLFQILGTLGLTWAMLVLYILIKNGHLKNNAAYVPAAGLAAANVGQLILLVGHLSPALYAYSIHGHANDPCDGVFIVLWYGSLGNVLLMAVSRCWLTWRPTRAKYVFTLRRMVILCVSGFVLGLCVSALPYFDICCHFAFQISSTVIDTESSDYTAPLFDQDTNASLESLLAVNYSVVVPQSDIEYLTIIKTNNVLLFTHAIDFFTVFVSVVCYGLVFYKVRAHGNKISAQQQQNHMPDRSPQSSQAASTRTFGLTGPRKQKQAESKNRNMDGAGTSGEGIQAGLGSYRIAIRRSTRPNQPGVSRTITSTSDVRMLRRISTHFCLMSSAVMLFSVILLIVHRYPNEPSLVLLHQLFYILTATVNSFLISTLNEKIRGDFRKFLRQLKCACCKPQTTNQGQTCCIRLCPCTYGNEETVEQRRTTVTVPTTSANRTTPMVVLDLAQGAHA